MKSLSFFEVGSKLDSNPVIYFWTCFDEFISTIIFFFFHVGESEKYFSSNCKYNLCFFVTFAIFNSTTGASYAVANGNWTTVYYGSACQLHLFAFFNYSPANDLNWQVNICFLVSLFLFFLFSPYFKIVSLGIYLKI